MQMIPSLKREARWYVYELIDPRDGAIFYVGKGTGDRISQHERDAAASNAVCSKKINKIRDIHSCGMQVAKRWNAYFWDEQAAYDHETDVIEAIGLHNLTNVLPGGQKAWVARQAARSESRGRDHIAQLLKAKDEKLFSLFAWWFKHKFDLGGRKAIVQEKGSALYWNARITEIAFNSLLPMIWKNVSKRADLIGLLAKRLRPYGVHLEVQHGGA